jgi:hypothetical protein
MGRTIMYVFSVLIIFSFTGCLQKKSAPAENVQLTDTLAGQQQQNVLTASEIEEGWHLLFDGKSTSGWRSFGKDSVIGWGVEDGNLVAYGQGDSLQGDIITQAQYTNFELSLEWKISPQGNSGIMYHVVENAHGSTWETGPEYQIIDNLNYPEKLENWQTTGANYAMHPPVNAKLRPVGEYNASRILVNGPHVEHWLNGTKVVEFEQWTDDWFKRVKEGKWKDYPSYGLAKTGHIALQHERNKLWFRNIKIRVIE